MKKIVSLLGIIALTLAGFTACNKVSGVETPSTGKHIIKVTPIMGATRTVITDDGNSVTAKWDADDIFYFNVWENGEPANSVEAVFTKDNTIAILYVDFDENHSNNLVYTSSFGSVDEGGFPMVEHDQSPTTSSIDPAADLLVGKKIRRTSQPDELQVEFMRPVALVKMTLTGLEAGDQITEVTIANNNGCLTGIYDAEDGEFNYSNGSTYIDLQYQAVQLLVDENGTAPIYFVSGPVSNAELSVEVYTQNPNDSDDYHMYMKDFTKRISFPANKLTRFTANLTGCKEY